MMPMPNEQQLRQLEHRCRILAGVSLSGQSVLEIGCGQGDMTVALANAVGEEGRVVAMDSAPTDYGAPMTLGDSHRHLMATPLGARMEFWLETTLETLPHRRFDWVVLAHSSWYMSAPEWGDLAAKLSDFGSRLLFAEWDLDDSPAAEAVLLQAKVASEVPDWRPNVRCARPFSEMRDSILATGWELVREAQLDTSELRDGRWEVQNALREIPGLLDADWVRAGLTNLEGVGEVRSLPASVAEFRLAI